MRGVDSTYRVLRRREVEQRVGMARSSLYAAVARGEFPRPVKLGGRSVAWIEREIAEWIAARIAERDAAARTEAGDGDTAAR